VQASQRERNSLTDTSFKSRPVEHLRIGTARMQLSFQNAHFLGAYPGVGASFYLPRLRGHIGMYLALTGARINVEDALYSGAVTHYVQTHRIDKLQKALTDSDFSISDEEVMAIVTDFAVSASELQLIHQDPHFKADKHPPSSSYYQRYVLQGVPEPTHLEDNIDDIDRCFGQTTLQGLVEELQATDSDWGRSTLGATAPRYAPPSPHPLCAPVCVVYVCACACVGVREWRAPRTSGGHGGLHAHREAHIWPAMSRDLGRHTNAHIWPCIPCTKGCRQTALVQGMQGQMCALAPRLCLPHLRAPILARASTSALLCAHPRSPALWLTCSLACMHGRTRTHTHGNRKSGEHVTDGAQGHFCAPAPRRNVRQFGGVCADRVAACAPFLAGSRPRLFPVCVSFCPCVFLQASSASLDQQASPLTVAAPACGRGPAP
jgi:hypothetical protein